MGSIEYWRRELAYQQANLAYEEARHERAKSGQYLHRLPPLPMRSSFHAAPEITKDAPRGLDAKMRARGWTEETALALGVVVGLVAAAAGIFGCVALLG